jgi:hypothetical protein
MKKPKIRDNRVGMKFYRYNANKELEVIRIKRVYSKDKVVVFNDGEPITHTRVMKLDQILNDWTSLVPDATISFNIVKAGKANDVMVYAVLADDMRDGNILPYVVCRTNETNYISSGKAYGNTTCRENDIRGKNSYRNAVMVDGYLKTCIVHMYMTDTPAQVLELIPNDNIHRLNATIAEFTETFAPYTGVDPKTAKIHEILNYTGFWTILDSAWKVENIPILINDSTINTLTKFIEDKCTSYIKDLEVVNYDKDIDLTKLPSDYMLVRDLMGIIYLATFFKVAGKKYTDNIDQYLKPEEIASILGK